MAAYVEIRKLVEAVLKLERTLANQNKILETANKNMVTFAQRWGIPVQESHE